MDEVSARMVKKEGDSKVSANNMNMTTLSKGQTMALGKQVYIDTDIDNHDQPKFRKEETSIQHASSSMGFSDTK